MEPCLKESARRGMFRRAGGILWRIRGRIGSLNPGQKKVFWGLVFFMLFNALMLALSIVVFTKLINKL